MSEIAVLDTSVLIDQIRTNRYLDRISSLDGVVRNCSVVLAELWRGATSRVDRKVVQALERNHPILTPTTNHWLESGHILAKIRDDKGFEPAKLRDLHFDVLIALTARAHGARVITSNRADFELIREYREFGLEVW
jgi:predicted nucleic acid-binding protein